MTAVTARSTGATTTGRAVIVAVLGAIVIVLLAILFLLPIVMLIVTAFREGSPSDPGAWTLEAVTRTLTNGRTWVVVGNSLVLATCASALGVLIGAFLAWVATRTTAPLRRVMTPVMAALLFLPTLFYGLGWVMLTRGPGAPLQQLARAVGLVEGVPSTGWIPMILVVTGIIIPVGYLFTLGPLQKMNGALDDAARVSGAGDWRAVRTVTLPLMAPTIVGLFVLMTAYSFSSFDLPLLFGLPAGIQVFSTAVYTTYSSSVGTPDYAGASALSMLLIVLVVLLVLLRNRLLAGRSYTTISGKGYRSDPRDFGRIQVLFTALFFLVACLIGVFPLLQMLIGSFQSYFGSGGGWTLASYQSVLSRRSFWSSVSITILLAVVGGFIAVAISTLLAYVARKKGVAFKRFADLITWAPASVPGVVIGLGLITAYLPIPGLRNLFGTVWFLLIGFVVVLVPIASRSVEGGILQISTELEEASRASGAGAVKTFARIAVPLITPSFLAGWFLCALVIAGDLSLPVLLSNATMQPVAVAAYQEYTSGNTSEAAAMFLLLIAVIFLLAGGIAAVLAVVRAVSRRVIRTRSLSSDPQR